MQSNKKASDKNNKKKKPGKNKIMRDVRSLFELEEGYCKPLRIGNTFSNNHVMVIKVKRYQ